MNFTVYEGTPLNTKSRDIRLIEVLPRNGDSPIHCKFHRHSIGSPDLEFQALSYTWGNLKPLSTIFIDNVAVEVRQNLVLFLRQHRSEASTSKCNPLMWIDALCIDQSNTNERNHQVALMKDIYSKASRVLVWLGPAAEHSGVAIEKIRKFPSNIKGKSTRPRSLWTHHEGNAILNLFSRRYWRRIWIIQEILLARRLTVLCGTVKFDWSALEALSSELDLLGDTWISHQSLALQIEASGAMKILHQRNLRKKCSLRGLDLHELLATHHDAECSDVRDRVYGLLGLASFPANAPLIAADYSISVRILYTQTLQHYKINYAVSEARLPHLSVLRQYAILLQQTFKLDHLDWLVEEELCKMASPRAREVYRYPSTSSAFSIMARSDENWTRVSDLAERRRIQNRVAQRNYRKKLRKRLEELERRAASSSPTPGPQSVV